MTEADQTLCYLQGCSNMVTMPTEIKRDPEKMPDAMIYYKQKPNNNVLHSMAMMTRDLSELPTGKCPYCLLWSKYTPPYI